MAGRFIAQLGITHVRSTAPRPPSSPVRCAHGEEHSLTLACLPFSQPRDVKWSHATNSVVQLTTALGPEGVNFVEADVIPVITTKSKRTLGTPVMGHPPSVDGALSFEDFLRRVRAHNAKVKVSRTPSTSAADATKVGIPHVVGIKVDFKHPVVVQQCLNMIRKSIDKAPLKAPLWLNADVWKGPGGSAPRFAARSFIAQCRKTVPEASLSLGWTTSLFQAQGYSAVHISQALSDLYHGPAAVLKPNPMASPPGGGRAKETAMVTFAVRAMLASRSPVQMMRLISAAPRGWKHSLTVWGEAGSAEQVRGEPPRLPLHFVRNANPFSHKLTRSLHIFKITSHFKHAI